MIFCLILNTWMIFHLIGNNFYDFPDFPLQGPKGKSWHRYGRSLNLHPVVAKQRWHGLLSSKSLRVLQIQPPALSNKGLIDSSISQCFQWRLGTNGTYAPLRSRKRKKLKTYQLNIFSHGSLFINTTLHVWCTLFICLFIWLSHTYGRYPKYF